MEKIKENKKVSVVMCTYNGEKYLKEQLDSILNQSHPVNEIIIQDDCSTDNTVDIIQDYQKNKKNIILNVNERNLGYNDNFISAAQKATGDYIAFSDQDDIWDSTKIEKQIAEMDKCMLCFHNTKDFSTDGTPVTDKATSLNLNHNLEFLIFFNSVSGHTIMMKKDLLEKVPHLNDLSSQYSYWIYDQIFAIVAESYGQISYINENLSFHRRLFSSATYVEPRKYLHSISGAIRYIISSFQLYKNKKDVMIDYFTRMYHLLSELPETNSQNAKRICRLQMKRSFLNYIYLSYDCIRLRKRFLTTFNEDIKHIDIGRIVLFPVFVSNYFKDKNRIF